MIFQQVGISLLVLLYVALTICVLRLPPAGERPLPARWPLLAVSAVGLLLHCACSYPVAAAAIGGSAGLGGAALLAALPAALLATAALPFPRAAALSALGYPAAALGLLAALFLPVQDGASYRLTPGFPLHLALSVLALGCMLMASLQAVAMAVQRRRLRRRPALPALPWLPSLQSMEELLFRSIVLGFFLLSLSLVTGLSFSIDLLRPPLAYKTLLSLLAWTIFGVLLWGQWVQGWRGRRVARWTLAGCVILLLAYSVTKIVFIQA
ncbi:MAG: cytochrome c biogenesis protein CcsA [Gammaproteobacteria bacterium]|nr:cytochrome c biogenesis protein CcsA [Gammaproteobacteria bacterium]MDD9863959.1 cytochrome c biogenesis protein CcsA [Gammaproteobacteria bacterium]